ncbi:ECF-type sigma factor [Stieleria sp. ICT_E10.1]|uniref:ECF-type sigma factor n=1 Tax=Stieleria sedimenti TaxID=2976331 RepID=UPI0021803820|nr:ECF-type sigma factor [Stieleria sedimenti]MCS7468592.1 ECF-type sigma factor [Stieleria sedimenti]
MSESSDLDQERFSSDDLIPLVYTELRRLAKRRLSDDRAGQSLDATGLVHEAFIRLSRDPNCQWNSRGHFFGAAAEAMRRILIERSRQRQTQKRGKGTPHESLSPEAEVSDRDERLIKLDEALDELEAVDVRKARLVKLRFFVGLTNEEIADALEIHLATVNRDWAYARAWLKREMAD